MLAVFSDKCQELVSLLFEGSVLSRVSHFILYGGGISLRYLSLEVLVEVRF